MSIHITKFSRASQADGVFKQNEQGNDLVKAKTSFKGRVAQFFKGLFKPGEVARENRGVMQAFVAALKASRFSYGEDYGNMAAQLLSTDIEQGKPLTGRKIKQVLDVLKERKGWMEQMNLQVAKPLTSLGQGSEFRALFAEVMAEKNLPTDPDRYDTMALRQNIETSVCRGRGMMEKFYPTSRAEARELAKEAIESFSAKPRRAMGVLIQTLDRDSTAFEPMQTTVLMSQSKIKEPGYLKGVLAMREAMAKGVKAMVEDGKSPSEIFQAMKGLKDSLNQKMSQMGMVLGAEDILNFYQDCMNFCAQSGDVSHEEMQKFVDLFSSPKGMDVKNSLEVMLKFPVRSDREVATRQAAGHSQQVLNRMAAAFGMKLGLSEEQQSALVKRPVVDTVSGNMSKEFMRMLESEGLAAPKGANGSYERLHGNFDQTLVTKAQDKINDMYTDGVDSWDDNGLSKYMLLDAERCDMTINGSQVGRPGMQKSDSADAWRQAFTRGDGIYDDKGARAVSGVLHQGLFSSVSHHLTMTEQGDGVVRPFTGQVGSEPGKEFVRFDVTTDESTGDMWVKMEYTTKPRVIMQMDPPGEQRLNQDQSSYSVVLQGRITRESIDSGTPKFEIMATQYDSLFIPE